MPRLAWNLTSWWNGHFLIQKCQLQISSAWTEAQLAWKCLFTLILGHAEDILFNVCNFLCPQSFCSRYVQRGLMQGDENWQDSRPGLVAGHLPFWWTLAEKLALKAIKWKILVTHFVDPLCNRAEILQDGREASAAGLR